MPQKETVTFIIGVLVATAAATCIALFYRADTSQVWDILKLVVQGAGALLIARLTVHWAIHTYKSQKTWERDEATYANVLSALREMKRCLDILWDDEIQARDYLPDYITKVTERLSDARKAFESASSLAVLLPTEVSSIILQLEEDLANGNYDSRGAWLDGESFLVNSALKEIEEKRKFIR